MARAFASELQKAAGQSIVVDNRGGAGATLGTELAAKAPPDGYVIYIGGSVSMVISPAIYLRVHYDPVRDFTPVSLVSQFYNAATVHPSLPVKSVKELIALMRVRPGALVMGSAGAGSTSHLAGELFNSMAGTQMLHVPYKSGGQLVVALLTGEVQISFSPISTVMNNASQGKVRMLAVTSPKRLPNLPELPTVAETVPGYSFGGWQGIFLPAGAAPDTVRQLHAIIIKAVDTPEFRQYLAREGSVLVGSTPEQLSQYLRGEIEKLTPIIRKSGAKAE